MRAMVTQIANQISRVLSWKHAMCIYLDLYTIMQDIDVARLSMARDHFYFYSTNALPNLHIHSARADWINEQMGAMDLLPSEDKEDFQHHLVILSRKNNVLKQPEKNRKPKIRSKSPFLCHVNMHRNVKHL